MRLIPALMTLLALLALLAGSDAIAQPTPRATPIVVDHVRSERMVKAMPVSGIVASRQEMQITAGVTGRVTWMAEPGTQVQAGDPVARLDDGPLRLELAEQQALLERDVVNHRYLEQEVQRLERLSNSDYVSAIDIEQARSQRDMAASDQRVAQARIDQLIDQLQRTTVRAPFAGVITSQAHFPGEDVSRGTALSHLMNTANLEVRAAVPLRFLGRTQVGDVLTVLVNGEELVGRVRTLVTAGDATSQTFEVRIDLPADRPLPLAVGQLTRVRVPLTTTDRLLAVPRDALVLRQEGHRVVRITADGKAEHVSVTLGPGHGQWIAVSGDLQEGDTVAVRGAERLRPGQSVHVVRDLAEERGNTDHS
ncbi:efflux RND transporter periplasmic adaptor subunit [Abyssibacter profundi]|nr:efflux RND transporter periplasmic adaptor subunit [Abyssibacter profundi]